MRIGILLSTLGGSPLQCGLERGLAELGHDVCDYSPGRGYDLVLMFNQSAHATGYVYPEFPGPEVPIAFVDCAEYGYFKRLPSVVGQFANAFSFGSMAHDTKNRREQERLRGFLEGRSFPYFLREFSRHVSYPEGYHPIDYPLYHLSVCLDKPDREEYLRREADLFVSWGASHPWRRQISEALRECAARLGLRAEIRVLNDGPGEIVPRMRQSEYFARTRRARCSVSFDGYGSGSFRMTEILVRTLLLQGPLSIVTRAPLLNSETCVDYAVASDGEEFLGTDICDVLSNALACPEAAFRVYERGYEHCMEHLTERATAAYVMRTVAAHDWGRQTDIDLARGDSLTG